MLGAVGNDADFLNFNDWEMDVNQTLNEIFGNPSNLLAKVEVQVKVKTIRQIFFLFDLTNLVRYFRPRNLPDLFLSPSAAFSFRFCPGIFILCLLALCPLRKKIDGYSLCLCKLRPIEKD